MIQCTCLQFHQKVYMCETVYLSMGENLKSEKFILVSDNTWLVCGTLKDRRFLWKN